MLKSYQAMRRAYMLQARTLRAESAALTEIQLSVAQARQQHRMAMDAKLAQRSMQTVTRV